MVYVQTRLLLVAPKRGVKFKVETTQSVQRYCHVLNSGVSFKALGSGGESSRTCHWVSPAGKTPCRTQYRRQWSDRGQTPPDCHYCPPLYPRCQISLHSDAQPGNRREEKKWKQIFGTLYAVHVLALFSGLLTTALYTEQHKEVTGLECVQLLWVRVGQFINKCLFRQR